MPSGATSKAHCADVILMTYHQGRARKRSNEAAVARFGSDELLPAQGLINVHDAHGAAWNAAGSCSNCHDGLR